MLNVKRSSLFVALSMVCSVGFSNGAHEVPLTDDSYVIINKVDDTVLSGFEESLLVDFDNTAYLKFSLRKEDSTIDEHPRHWLASPSVKKAILWVFGSKDSEAGEVTVDQVNTEWTEESLQSSEGIYTINPASRINGVTRTIIPLKTTAFDVTDMVIKAMQTGVEISFRLSTTNSETVILDAKENETTSRGARLFITEHPVAGLRGADGAPGADGVPGPMGPQGEKGEVGPQGPEGVAGPMGPSGPQGPQGERGADGVGVGIPGPQGPQGPKGDTGHQGPKGHKGDKGDKGDKGHKGDKGDPGKDGTCKTYCK
jgi:hypothetical protein